MNFKHLYHILFVFIIFVLFACNDNSGDNNKNSDSINLNYNDSTYIKMSEGEQVEKTVFVDDTIILFFMPSKKKKQELIKYFGVYDQYELEIIFRNFENLYINTTKMIKNRDIKIDLSYAEKFIFLYENDTIIYDLEDENQYFGYILADGINMPLIKNGVQKTNDVSNDIRNYFNLKNFSYNQEEIIPEEVTVKDTTSNGE